VTSNIIAIITFAYVLVIGFFYRARAVAEAEGDIFNISIEAFVRRRYFDRWTTQGRRQHAFTLDRRLEQKLDSLEGEDAISGALRDLQAVLDLQALLPVQMAERELEKVEKMLEAHNYRAKWQKYWLSWRFLQIRDRLKEGLHRYDALLENAKDLLEASSESFEALRLMMAKTNARDIIENEEDTLAEIRSYIGETQANRAGHPRGAADDEGVTLADVRSYIERMQANRVGHPRGAADV
jgi:hypothetical protein